MTARSIRAEELDACCAPGNGKPFAEIARTFWKENSSSPDLCFAVEHDGRFVGRVFFHHNASAREFHAFGFHIDPSVDFSVAGMALFGIALPALAGRGATKVGFAVFDIYDERAEQTETLYEALGFRPMQAKRRYVWKDSGSPVVVPARLVFRSLSSVGEDVFIDAFRRVTEATLDRDDQADIARYGLAAAGPGYMALLKDIEYLPEEWQLGFTTDGRLCGLVVPQLIALENEGTINYIGVVPEQRGSGYGFDFLLKGMALLQRRGIKKVVAETDTENRPLHAHLERAGYIHHGTLKTFRYEFNQPATA